ncbi:protein BIG GRAIN B [Trifolium repens]|nr:protein BIG GRAIN B [Trifolium repens]
MYKSENTRREGRVLIENPSFSSTLLDKIYRSIDEGDTKGCSNMKFYTETTINRHSKTNVGFNRVLQEEPNLRLNVGTQRTTKIDRKLHHDEDVLFFSSGSSSSDSSSGLLSSSSETESIYRAKSRGSCFAPSRPKPVKTTVPPERIISNDEDILIKSKSRALKIYNNLKKVKQPISPGGKLTSFLNSLFINTNKTKTVASSYEDTNAERKAKSGLASTCSSASSFSRSCLSKNSSTSRDKLHNGVKRTVRFYPVSVIVDEDNQPCGHKCLYGGVTKKKKEEEKVLEKSKRVEEVAREFIREYHLNKKILRDFSMRKNEEVVDDDDDVASCSSSDLFELDHLSVMGNDNRYCEDLPVFETTHVRTNRAIRIM